MLTSPGGELPFTLRIMRRHSSPCRHRERGGAGAVGVDVHDGSVTIRFDGYDSAINATLSNDGNAMTGAWTRRVPAGMCRLAFHATRGKQPRFLPAPPDSTSFGGDVRGIWKAEFADSDGVSPARGEFHQDFGSSRVTGTFLPDRRRSLPRRIVRT